ncbi:hypothetical protein ACXYTP_24735 [Tsukamurella ocularis]
MSTKHDGEYHEPTAAVRLHRNDWPIEAIHDALLMPCSKIRAQLDRAEVESQGYTRDHIVRSKLT